jgi:hypothetical protein
LADAGGPLSRVLSSPRRRRRLAWTSGILVLSGALAFVGVNYANTGKKIPQHFTNQPPQLVPPAPRAAALTADDRNAARAVAERFIDTAVLRQRVDDSWEITAPALRQGFTRANWATGNIPVVPFQPANAVEGIKYRVDWSGVDKIYLKIAIIPKPSANVTGGAFDMGLERTGPAGTHQWLVDYWVPSGASSASPRPGSKGGPPLVRPELKSRLGAAWIAAPLGGIIFLLLAVPLTLVLRGALRTRRANRLYRES